MEFFKKCDKDKGYLFICTAEDGSIHVENSGDNADMVQYAAFAINAVADELGLPVKRTLDLLGTVLYMESMMWNVDSPAKVVIDIDEVKRQINGEGGDDD